MLLKIDKLYTMYRNAYFRVLTVFLIFTLFAVPLFAATKEDPCEREGIVVKNLTMLDLWHKKNNSECFILIHNHIFRIKPEDTVDIFSDLACNKLYCKDNPTYKDYKSFDTNGDCRVRILPDCTLSDM